MGSRELVLAETVVNFQWDLLLFFSGFDFVLLTLGGQVNQTSICKAEALPAWIVG